MRSCLSGRRRSVVITVEVDLGDLDLALLLLLLGLVGVGDLDMLGTTTLLVLDLVGALLAVGGLLADGTVRHIVVELETSLKLHIDLKLLDGELVYAGLGACSEGQSALIVPATVTNDLLTTAIFFTGPALEVEAVVEVEAAGQEVLPVKASLERLVALVVGVTGACELVGVVPLLAETTLAELSSKC